MSRPAFVCCDTDAVIQFLLAGQVQPFRTLRDRYAIQPIIVPEVELELRSHKRLGQRIAPELKRTLHAGLLRVLDRSILENHFGAPPANAMAAAKTLGDIAALGAEFNRFVDLGEAYTHASAIVLKVPSLSNDGTALSALARSGYPLPVTVLRAFDLVALCYQVKDLTEVQCDELRTFLIQEREGVPPSFKNRSFVDGLAHFTPRVTDFKAPDVGVADPLASGFAKAIVL